MKNKKILYVLLAILLVAGGIFVYMRSQKSKPETLSELYQMNQSDLTLNVVRYYEDGGKDGISEDFILSDEDGKKLMDTLFSATYQKIDASEMGSIGGNHNFYQVEMWNESEERWVNYEFYRNGIVELETIDKETGSDKEFLVKIAEDSLDIAEVEDFIISNSNSPIPCRKPVIYLYPEEEMDVRVKLDYEGELQYTYPAYDEKAGWEVTAAPSGKLVNKADGREYSYLFWEGNNDIEYDFSKGFVVKGEDTVEFLQEKLAEIGLLPHEYNEFIVYWLPQMQDNAYNLISFQGVAYTDSAKLSVEPQPDSAFRVFMAFKALNNDADVKALGKNVSSMEDVFDINLEPQVFETFERNGFTLVEWGGTEVE